MADFVCFRPPLLLLLISTRKYISYNDKLLALALPDKTVWMHSQSEPAIIHIFLVEFLVERLKNVTVNRNYNTSHNIPYKCLQREINFRCTTGKSETKKSGL